MLILHFTPPVKSVNQTVCVGELRDCERCILVYGKLCKTTNRVI